MIAAVKDLPPRVRAMRQVDVPQVAALEKASYEYPWSAGIFRDCLLAGYTSVVLEQDAELIGYAVMSVAAGEAHLLNICLAEHVRRQGIARRLLRHMLDLAMQAGAERLFLEVRPSNKDALRLYRAAGFRVVDVRRGYYRAPGGNEDAVVLVYHMTKPD